MTMTEKEQTDDEKLEVFNKLNSLKNELNELGYNKYERDINNNIYRIENTKIFFVGENKALYIIYPYGNANYTTELDLLVI